MSALFRRWLVAGCLAASALGQQPTAEGLDLPALLQRLVDLDRLWQPPVAGERCVQFSSHDRRSAEGRGDAGAWYANDDRGHYLRTVERDGGREYVLADLAGPGCIARIWSANPSGTLHFDLDGQRVWSVDFAALCSGQLDGVPEPIAGMRSRGGNCYLPIGFARSLVVSATAADLYYAVDVVRWPAGQRVQTFRPEQLVEHAAAIRALVAGFPRAEPPFTTQLFGPADRVPTKVVVPAGRIVRLLRVSLPRDIPVDDRREIARNSLLVVHCGDEETVRVPLTEFFAGGPDWSPHSGRCLSIRGDTGHAAWPMPMPQGGRIEILSEPDYRELSPCFDFVDTEPLTATEPLLFRASYHLAKAQRTRPFGDHLVLDGKGRGRFVGCTLSVRNPSRIWWGEGDEKFTVDGEAFPSWFGTGTEDYFGYAWCDPTPFSAPFHAQVACQGPMNFGFTTLHRSHVLDSVPFASSFRFELERWHWVEDAAIDYATVAYWYGAPAATTGLPAVPPAAERELPRLEAPPMLAVADALEGEALAVTSCSGGTHEVQDLGIFERMLSHDRHRWWRDGKPGDALVLELPVAKAGRYRVLAAFVMADDFGIVQVQLAGKALGAPFDGYAAKIGSSGPRELGVLDLPAGAVALRLELVGKNAAAKASHMVGLDYVRLEAIE